MNLLTRFLTRSGPTKAQGSLFRRVSAASFARTIADIIARCWSARRIHMSAQQMQTGRTEVSFLIAGDLRRSLEPCQCYRWLSYKQHTEQCESKNAGRHQQGISELFGRLPFHRKSIANEFFKFLGTTLFCFGYAARGAVIRRFQTAPVADSQRSCSLTARCSKTSARADSQR